MPPPVSSYTYTAHVLLVHEEAFSISIIYRRNTLQEVLSNSAIESCVEVRAGKTHVAGYAVRAFCGKTVNLSAGFIPPELGDDVCDNCCVVPALPHCRESSGIAYLERRTAVNIIPPRSFGGNGDAVLVENSDKTLAVDIGLVFATHVVQVEVVMKYGIADIAEILHSLAGELIRPLNDQLLFPCL